jgi:hypothetical protein
VRHQAVMYSCFWVDFSHYHPPAFDVVVEINKYLLLFNEFGKIDNLNLH